MSARWRAVERRRSHKKAQTKEEGSDYAEPSQEGPVGSTTGNRPLNNQFPVNPRLPSKTQDPDYWAWPDPARASLWGRDVGTSRSKYYAEARERGDSINP